MTASEAPLAGVRVDREVMRLAALFVQPDGSSMAGGCARCGRALTGTGQTRDQHPTARVIPTR